MRLRVLLPIVENAIAGAAFRPGDIIRSRKGLSVEIGNTDAEGRLILADALACADEEETDLLIDFATLTGAARVALGPELAAFYATDEAFAQDVARQSLASNDPVMAVAAVGALCADARQPRRRHQQCRGGSVRRLHRRGAVSSAVRHAR